jgi:hypothetical protein
VPARPGEDQRLIKGKRPLGNLPDLRSSPSLSSNPASLIVLPTMNRPLKFKPWNPTQPKRTARRPATTGRREPQSITSKEPLPTVSRDGDCPPPIFTEWGESADFNPYEELRSIEDIIDEAMRSSASSITRSSSSVPDPFCPTEVIPGGLTDHVMADSLYGDMPLTDGRSTRQGWF